VKASRTGTKVERSLLAAESSVWVAGVVVGRVAGRGDWFRVVGDSLEVVVNMGMWWFLGK
jgi:hypothetical protein